MSDQSVIDEREDGGSSRRCGAGTIDVDQLTVPGDGEVL